MEQEKNLTSGTQERVVCKYDGIFGKMKYWEGHVFWEFSIRNMDITLGWN